MYRIFFETQDGNLVMDTVSDYKKLDANSYHINSRLFGELDIPENRIYYLTDMNGCAIIDNRKRGK